MPDGVRLYASRNGIVSSTGDSVAFVRDAQGRITDIVTDSGAHVVYRYDSNGDLASVHDTSTGDTTRFGYSQGQPHLLELRTSAGADAGVAAIYGPTVTLQPLAADLGGADGFDFKTYQGQLAAGADDYVAFNIRAAEIASTLTGHVLIGVDVRSSDPAHLVLSAPVLDDLTPIATRTDADGIYQLYAIDTAGLQRLRIASANGAIGGYKLSVYVVGDTDGNGTVDGLDSKALNDALGASVGGAKYRAAIDANRDGTIDASDAELLGANYGFHAVPPPSAKDFETLTHKDLPVVVDLDAHAVDPSAEPLSFTLGAALHGHAVLNPDGHTVTFTPDAGYVGAASFSYQADDGFNRSNVAAATFNVSDAALVRLDFVQREPRLDAVGSSYTVEVIGDFADQTGVTLTSGYVNFQSLDPSIVTVTANGELLGAGLGSTVLTVSSHGLEAATAVTVGAPSGGLAKSIFDDGLNVYPGVGRTEFFGERARSTSMRPTTSISPPIFRRRRLAPITTSTIRASSPSAPTV